MQRGAAIVWRAPELHVYSLPIMIDLHNFSKKCCG